MTSLRAENFATFAKKEENNKNCVKQKKTSPNVSLNCWLTGKTPLISIILFSETIIFQCENFSQSSWICRRFFWGEGRRRSKSWEKSVNISFWKGVTLLLWGKWRPREAPFGRDRKLKMSWSLFKSGLSICHRKKEVISKFILDQCLHNYPKNVFNY